MSTKSDFLKQLLLFYVGDLGLKVYPSIPCIVRTFACNRIVGNNDDIITAISTVT